MISSFSSDNERVLITVHDAFVSPRFDMSFEIIVAEKGPGNDVDAIDKKYFLLSEPSTEELVRTIQNEGVHAVICGGIEDEHYQYLTWKKIKVYCNVIGPFDKVLEAWASGRLSEDMIFPG